MSVVGALACHPCVHSFVTLKCDLGPFPLGLFLYRAWSPFSMVGKSSFVAQVCFRVASRSSAHPTVSTFRKCFCFFALISIFPVISQLSCSWSAARPKGQQFTPPFARMSQMPIAANHIPRAWAHKPGTVRSTTSPSTGGRSVAIAERYALTRPTTPPGASP